MLRRARDAAASLDFPNRPTDAKSREKGRESDGHPKSKRQAPVPCPQPGLTYQCSNRPGMRGMRGRVQDAAGGGVHADGGPRGPARPGPGGHGPRGLLGRRAGRGRAAPAADRARDAAGEPLPAHLLHDPQPAARGGPQGAPRGSARVGRGGCWRSAACRPSWADQRLFHGCMRAERTCKAGCLPPAHTGARRACGAGLRTCLNAAVRRTARASRGAACGGAIGEAALAAFTPRSALPADRSDPKLTYSTLPYL